MKNYSMPKKAEQSNKDIINNVNKKAAAEERKYKKAAYSRTTNGIIIPARLLNAKIERETECQRMK